ncbi:MAG: hypothetical protein OXJ55_18510 [Caldilineaceae bacterium]|nr:hypothetical protein [Caldilineaceae bacterium]MDE0463763.1 hypothetical protein [Caldilineaceae bacterium]
MTTRSIPRSPNPSAVAGPTARDSYCLQAGNIPKRPACAPHLPDFERPTLNLNGTESTWRASRRSTETRSRKHLTSVFAVVKHDPQDVLWAPVDLLVGRGRIFMFDHAGNLPLQIRYQ